MKKIRIKATYWFLGFCICLAVCLTSACALPVSQSGEVQVSVNKNKKIELTNLPIYDGKPYVVLKDNKADFKEADLTTEPFEKYSDLDSLGRCQVAYANICKEIMPKQERGPIGMVKPAGWHTIKYACIDGKYLYNRCHLIGYQLAGENANEKNLITGTRYLNVEGMLPFENQVADFVEATGYHVLYRVTPIYKGEELLARGVEMEAYSVDDQGSGLQFHVYVYNVQPQIDIDYQTGESSLQKKSALTKKNFPSKEKNNNKQKKSKYIINTNTKKYHLPTCSCVADMREKNKKVCRATRKELEEEGYEPCKKCCDYASQ